jgi:hypothetical protein
MRKQKLNLNLNRRKILMRNQNEKEEQGKRNEREDYYEREFRWRSERDIPSSGTDNKVFWGSTTRSS